MCGITGYVRVKENITSKQRTLTKCLIQLLLTEIESRGWDASGYAYVTKAKSHPLMFKAPIPSSELAASTYLENSLNRYPPRVFIGHARAGTSGTEDFNINNHPFVTRSGRMFLVHNGIVHDWKTRDTLENKLIGGCDTEMIIRLIETHGIKETLETMSNWNWSSYALLIMDTQKEVLYMFRRNNPIHFVNIPELGGLFIASEKQMLERSIKALNIKTKNLKFYTPVHEVLARVWSRNNQLNEDSCGRYESTKTYTYMSNNKSKGYNGGMYGV